MFRLRRWYHALKYFARFDEFKIVIGSIMAKLATIIQFVSCEDEIDTNVDGGYIPLSKPFDVAQLQAVFSQALAGASSSTDVPMHLPTISQRTSSSPRA